MYLLGILFDLAKTQKSSQAQYALEGSEIAVQGLSSTKWYKVSPTKYKRLYVKMRSGVYRVSLRVCLRYSLIGIVKEES